MLIAQEKRKTNIAEYILYIWQLEDLIRAFHFEMEKIGSALATQFDVDADKQIEIYEYYKNMMLLMQKEKVQQAGHIQAIVNVADDVNDFHHRLLKSGKDIPYVSLYQLAKPILDEFRLKSNNVDQHDVETALNLLYGLMMLKLQHKEITKPTLEASKHISKMLAHLSAQYKRYEENLLELD
ncbi:MAG: DUF4924 family protein [Mangrovibacterium sp.]